MLATGYLFSALMVIPYALTFPGVFAPTGLLGADLQSAVWLYIFWHVASPLSIVVYQLLKDDRKTPLSNEPLGTQIVLSIAIVIAIACGLIWLVTAQHDLLPRLMTAPISVPRYNSPLRVSSYRVFLRWRCCGFADLRCSIYGSWSRFPPG